jgi:dTDP-4-dehydrorhamnose reductase
MSGLELWGGHECTVNRVGDQFFDQTVRTGHQDRSSDLVKWAEVGFKALRYPVLWERISPERPDRYDWAWTDERLALIRSLGVRPIAGLTHHGSGPRYTSLIEDSFATGLAAHAKAVAERYPWLEAYTPVNEPLTTARFSALYGHWYPHLRDEAALWVALLNEVDATRFAMREIRKVNPAAQLIQTEDLGYTHSTKPLQEQARFENERRWLTWDLLTGKVTPGHVFWERLEWAGLADRARAIADDPCPPDVLGLNSYLTSERFLDHRFTRYPEHTRGGNGRMNYADVEAVRVADPGPLGLERLLEQAWDRYGLPVAITESHNGCTREEQMRWFYDAWLSAVRLRERGVDVRAVTSWALIGGYDWNRLLTAAQGHYELGAYDIRGGDLRPTE